jgi:hypothetical protein
MSATTPVAAISEDRMSGRACPATIVAITAPVVVIVVVALTSNLASQIAAVMSKIAALGARDRAVRTIDAPFLPNLALALAQRSRFASGQLAGANSAADVTMPVALRKRIG